MEKFGQRIRKHLDDNHISIADLAKMAGLKYTSVSSLLRKNRTTTDTLFKITKALNIEPYKLFLPHEPLSMLALSIEENMNYEKRITDLLTINIELQKKVNEDADKIKILNGIIEYLEQKNHK